jgi:hypothetical protein
MHFAGGAGGHIAGQSCNQEQHKRRSEKTRGICGAYSIKGAGQSARGRNRQRNANCHPNQNQAHPLTDDQSQYLRSARSKRHANADFPLTLVY